MKNVITIVIVIYWNILIYIEFAIVIAVNVINQFLLIAMKNAKLTKIKVLKQLELNKKNNYYKDNGSNNWR